MWVSLCFWAFGKDSRAHFVILLAVRVSLPVIAHSSSQSGGSLPVEWAPTGEWAPTPGEKLARLARLVWSGMSIGSELRSGLVGSQPGAGGLGVALLAVWLDETVAIRSHSLCRIQNFRTIILGMLNRRWVWQEG